MLQCLANAELSVAGKALPELKVLMDGQRCLHRVLVAEIMAGRRNRRKILAAALHGDSPRSMRQEASDHAQQSRLARTVGAGDHKRLAVGERKADIGKNRLATAFTAEIFGDKPHTSPVAETISLSLRVAAK